MIADGFNTVEERSRFRISYELGVSGVEVEHSTVSDVTPGAADLFIVARDLEDFIAGIPEDEKIVLSNILDKDEMKEKLTEKFGL